MSLVITMAISVNGDDSVVELMFSIVDSPARKHNNNEPGTTPTSVQSSTSKGFGEILNQSNEKLMKVINMTKGRRYDVFNHLKAAAECIKEQRLWWYVRIDKDR
ncbi:uncharacterized protein [Rutidosis leptorrhynchoides]|uniref:uncharacterized protein isoform X2 n=1 Tax=Rutidosis leptorrhynchoides TaxID=125765 RepID=UPI003A98DC63